MRNTRRRAAAVLLGATAIVAAGTYNLAHGASPRPRAANADASRISPSEAAARAIAPHYGAVALIGDSLSLQSNLEEQAQLRIAGWGPITHNAWFGRRTPSDPMTLAPLSGIAAVQEVRAQTPDPETWIIELGTNDISVTHDNAPAMRSVIDAMLATIGPGHRIVWVNIHNGFDLRSSATFNRVLDEVAAERNDLVVADWASQAPHVGYLVADHIHLTAEGQAAFAKVIAGAADLVTLR
ncbi:MAG: hypothetical protein QOI55_81 [Actinomycetota bacterium]|nr:hypothetical protein [Actinomycetota bacterium]